MGRQKARFDNPNLLWVGLDDARMFKGEEPAEENSLNRAAS